MTLLTRAPRLGRREVIDRINVAFDHPVLVAGEEEPVVRVVHPYQPRHGPIALCQLRPSSVSEAVEVVEAAALRPPDETAVPQWLKVVVEVDPRRRRLRHNNPALPRRGIDRQQV